MVLTTSYTEWKFLRNGISKSESKRFVLGTSRPSNLYDRDNKRGVINKRNIGYSHSPSDLTKVLLVSVPYKSQTYPISYIRKRKGYIVVFFYLIRNLYMGFYRKLRM